MQSARTGARAVRWWCSALSAGGLAALATALLCPAVASPAGSAAGPGGSPAEGVVLVPPEAGPHGRLRIEALAVDPDIDHVVFFVDGKETEVDDRRPYRVDLEPQSPAGSAVAGPAAKGHAQAAPTPTRPARPRVRAVAYDRRGAVLGEDALELGRPAEPFRLSISTVETTPAGGVHVAADLSVPESAQLDRVEVFHGGQLAATLHAPPFEITLPAATVGPDDYVRMVARLRDGRTLEDASPLLSAAAADRLNICLIDLFAVVSDRWGEPIRGLGSGDFRVRLHDRPLPVERFREASEVPLALGLLIDSSESMALIMDETREAARRFLDHTLIPGDQALLVGIGTVPRVLHEMTGSREELAAGFADLEAGGTTALYDAILLGLLRLERHPGRRALVVLSDGHDVGSDFGPGRCLHEAQRAGVPIYVLSLAGLPGHRTNPERNYRLEAMARRTGGRVLPITTIDELDRAYAEIDRELRSQYVLGVGSERVLSEDELAALDIQVDRPGARVRATTGRPSSDRPNPDR